MIVTLAVPDGPIGAVARDVVPLMTPGALLLRSSRPPRSTTSCPKKRRDDIGCVTLIRAIRLVQLGTRPRSFRDFSRASRRSRPSFVRADVGRGDFLMSWAWKYHRHVRARQSRPFGEPLEQMAMLGTSAGRDAGADVHGKIVEGRPRPLDRRAACRRRPCAISCSAICVSESRCSSAV